MDEILKARRIARQKCFDICDDLWEAWQGGRLTYAEYSARRDAVEDAFYTNAPSVSDLPKNLCGECLRFPCVCNR